MDKKGHIIKFVHENFQAWHAGPGATSSWGSKFQLNRNSVGIELLHNNNYLENKDDYTAEQYTSLVWLLNQIRTCCPNVTPSHILGHSDVRLVGPKKRLGEKIFCPGNEFDWGRLQREGLGLMAQRTLPTSQPLYGDYFINFPNKPLRRNDSDKTSQYGGRPLKTFNGKGIVREVQRYLRAIGYFCSYDGEFDEVTQYAVFMFQIHVFHRANQNPLLDYPAPENLNGKWGYVDKHTGDALYVYQPGP
jgi:N-acetyl-anhydromuramyl-L-alanine amidase AmpD